MHQKSENTSQDLDESTSSYSTSSASSVDYSTYTTSSDSYPLSTCIACTVVDLNSNDDQLIKYLEIKIRENERDNDYEVKLFDLFNSDYGDGNICDPSLIKQTTKSGPHYFLSFYQSDNLRLYRLIILDHKLRLSSPFTLEDIDGLTTISDLSDFFIEAPFSENATAFCMIVEMLIAEGKDFDGKYKKNKLITLETKPSTIFVLPYSVFMFSQQDKSYPRWCVSKGVVGEGGQKKVRLGYELNADDKFSYFEKPIAMAVFNYGKKPSKKKLAAFEREYNIAQVVLGADGTLARINNNGMEKRYFLMEYYEGHTLSSILKRDFCNFSILNRIKMCIAICKALSEFHSKGYIHGDITPRNIIIRIPEMEVSIIDVGLSWNSDEKITVRNSGTPGFHTFDSFVRDEIITNKVDIYSIGIIIAIVLSGGKDLVLRKRLEKFELFKYELAKNNPDSVKYLTHYLQTNYDYVNVVNSLTDIYFPPFLKSDLMTLFSRLSSPHPKSRPGVDALIYRLRSYEVIVDFIESFGKAFGNKSDIYKIPFSKVIPSLKALLKTNVLKEYFCAENVRQILSFLSLFKIDDENNVGKNLLMLAADKSDIEEIRALLFLGACIDLYSSSGECVLDYIVNNYNAYSNGLGLELCEHSKVVSNLFNDITKFLGDGRKGDRTKKNASNALTLPVLNRVLESKSASPSQKLLFIEKLFKKIIGVGSSNSNKLYTRRNNDYALFFLPRRKEPLSDTQIEHISILKEAYIRICSDNSSNKAVAAIAEHSELIDFQCSHYTCLQSDETASRSKLRSCFR